MLQVWQRDNMQTSKQPKLGTPFARGGYSAAHFHRHLVAPPHPARTARAAGAEGDCRRVIKWMIDGFGRDANLALWFRGRSVSDCGPPRTSALWADVERWRKSLWISVWIRFHRVNDIPIRSTKVMSASAYRRGSLVEFGVLVLQHTCSVLVTAVVFLELCLHHRNSESRIHGRAVPQVKPGCH